MESPDRFARDLAVQLAGHDHLRKLGVTLIPASAPDFFTEDTPTAVLVRQVLGAIAQFEKATTVAKLKAARDRKISAGEGNPDQLERAGESILRLIDKAADVAEGNTRRALTTAEELAHELRDAKDRIAELENEVAIYRDRADRGEQWLRKIYREIDKQLLQQSGERT